MGRWAKFLVRSLISVTVAFVVAMVPWVLPVPAWWAFTVVPAAVFCLICYTGKSLYDTLFYDRYWR